MYQVVDDADVIDKSLAFALELVRALKLLDTEAVFGLYCVVWISLI